MSLSSSSSLSSNNPARVQSDSLVGDNGMEGSISGCPNGTTTTKNNNTNNHTSNGRVEDDTGVIAAPVEATTLNAGMEVSESVVPAEIPPEPNGEDEDDDESEYEYEEDDDAAFSGFLVKHDPLPSSRPVFSTQQQSSISSSSENNNRSDEGGKAEPARIRDEEESVTISSEPARKSKWREPSREAVSMSLRAEREKTGGKRRLAQDLYRIMNQDTDEAGFSIAPKSEDTMDNWVIKLFKFDPDSNLAKDMIVLGSEHVELEMTFPEQYPFEPPFVRVVRPRFKRQTGFVMNGALCMELLTSDGWNPVNDIESVIVSIRSLLVVGDGRLQAAYDLSASTYKTRLLMGKNNHNHEPTNDGSSSRKRAVEDGGKGSEKPLKKMTKEEAGAYSLSEARAAYSHLLHYHKKKGWDSSGWWARKG